MANRIEVAFKEEVGDTRAVVRRERLRRLGFNVDNVSVADVYTLDLQDLQFREKLEATARLLANPVSQTARIDEPQSPGQFDWAIEIGYLPGVRDNIGHTTTELMQDAFNSGENEAAYYSQVTFVRGGTREEARKIAERLANPLIQRIHIKSREEFERDRGMGVVVPKVKLDKEPKADLVEILNSSDEELVRIGKQGIANSDGTRRGPLALDLTYMHAIIDYFRQQGRNPTDIELESIGQTWSEHCKHTIFADAIDDIQDGLFRHFIKRATEEIRTRKGDKDFCVSVFEDNSGVIDFDKDNVITLKVETHNSPSALDPYGGSITGIVGVNRDPIGTGLGSKPFINLSGPFCFADPNDTSPLYKGANFTQRMLLPRQILDGVVDGVKDGGNCSGIPTSHFRLIFDPGYKGKPLVYVGTGGIMPRTSLERLTHEKQAIPGDYIVMVGGRVGKDGIHGATFSSEALDTGSPQGAVQIGDPITQKKMSDALVKEARDLGLYTSITDNGAGGLSCSVAEMARESGGCRVYLDKVPLKYPGLEPWEIWVSESQERMTLSVPKNKTESFLELMRKRGVEATVIGEFTDSGKCEVDFNGNRIVDIDMDFLHDGLPPRPMKTSYSERKLEEPDFPEPEDLTSILLEMMARQNIASIEFINRQYDHEVQGGSVLKPLQGRGRVNGDATVTRPILDSMRGVVISQGINPSYSEINTYHMAACAIDTAIRNAVATGADLEHLALLDNFCWCSSDKPERLRQLKDAAEACYDYATMFGTPFISGKDSMFNDFKGFDEKGNPVKISIPPTLLITAVGVMQDSRKAVSIDAKVPGDLVYVLGATDDELGGSEYYAMMGEKLRGQKFVGNGVPNVSAVENREIYSALSKAIEEEIIASATSVNIGGLGVALARTAMAGRLGLEVSLENLPGIANRNDNILFSESQGRFVVTVSPRYKSGFEKLMRGHAYAEIGEVTMDDGVLIKDACDGEVVVHTSAENLLKSYKSTFEGY